MSMPPLRIQIAGLVLLVLALYYPALDAPLNPLDDRAIVDWLYNTEQVPLTELLFQPSDYYYRPLLLASYRLDWILWGAASRFMHLGNLLLHCANALLVLACARSVVIKAPGNGQAAAFAVALLFAVHPLNSEAVCWIAGRSDLLAGSLVLTAAWLLVHGLQVERPVFAWASILPLTAGAAAKETALFFLPAAIAIIAFSHHAKTALPTGFGSLVRQRLGFFIPYLILPGLYLALRLFALSKGDAGVNLARKFLAALPADPWSSVHGLVSGVGFYARKLFWPWPLNFTIDRVPPDSFWLGVATLTILAWLAWRRKPSAGMALATLCIATSALLVLVLRPAWTPVAERYMYIPSAFFCFTLIPAIEHGLPKRSAWLRGFCGLSVLAVIAVTTFQRALVWRDNILLMEDSVRKSPDFPFARLTLADLYIEAGRVEEGRAIIRTLKAPEGLRNAEAIDLRRARLFFEEGQLREARAVILAHRRPGSQLYYEFQKLLAKIDSALVEQTSAAERTELLVEAVAVHRELYDKLKDPFYLYLLGQIFLRAGDRQQAAPLFAQASREAPATAHYRDAAAKLATSLEAP